ncbi:OB-fold domain-containing protein [Gordonia sp. CPCC 205515]|uniref:Zn-ribbon domain-containing OB-fold protein n=1 Tax=Gordonia sp. CPCC 205515 TaxID=3140791 RepID=UPI003AF333DD
MTQTDSAIAESDWPHPFPTPVRRTDGSAAFFDAAHEGRVQVLRCTTCGNHGSPLDSVCAQCGATQFDSELAVGSGTVVCWAVVHRSPLPDVTGPYRVAIVELLEGPWLSVRVLGDHDEPLVVGDQVTFVAVPSGMAGEGEPVLAVVTAQTD